MKQLRNTKIICTIGPSSNNYVTLKALVEAGMNIMRLNFSHGDHESHLKCINLIRQINQELNTNVSVLLDTKGPEIRTHQFVNDEVTISKNSNVDIYMDEILGDEHKFSITYPELINDIKPGKNILVDDGNLTLVVTDIDYDAKIIHTLSKNSATIKSRRGINVPGTRLSMEFISDKDYEDLVFGCVHDVDFIAASFTRCKEDILKIREILKEQHKENIQIIAKIESTEAIKNFDDILSVADAVMIARGDLGVEMPIYEIPIMQRHLIHRCLDYNKPVIVATQMLESMIKNPIPTRAEVNDIASAVLSGVDCIMLSGETASGMYPVASVKMMHKTAFEAEKAVEHQKFINRAKQAIQKDINSMIAASTIETTSMMDIKAIIVPTHRGVISRRLSNFRSKTPIIATCMNEEVMRKLSILYGVHTVKMDYQETTEAVISKAIEVAKDKFDLTKGDLVAVTCNSPLDIKKCHANMMKIEEIE